MMSYREVYFIPYVIQGGITEEVSTVVSGTQRLGDYEKKLRALLTAGYCHTPNAKYSA